MAGDYNEVQHTELNRRFLVAVRVEIVVKYRITIGMTYETTEDIEYLKNRLVVVPCSKVFLGYEEGLVKKLLGRGCQIWNRTIERFKESFSELTKVGIVHLYSQGYTDAELVNFELSLTSPSTIYEQEKIELWSNKINLARDMKDNQMMSTEWIYKHIFNFSDDQIEQMDKELVHDQKTKFRFDRYQRG